MDAYFQIEWDPARPSSSAISFLEEKTRVLKALHVYM